MEPEGSADAGHIHRGLAWAGVATAGTAVMDLATTMLVLHLFVSPAEYGVAGLVTALFPILDYATDLGLSAAVIGRKDQDPDQISTVFWLSVALALVATGALALLGPLYARFMGHPILAGALLAYGGKLVIQNLYLIPTAMLKRALRFRETYFIRLGANVVEVGTVIALAARGHTVWCFVVAPIVRVVVSAAATQLVHPWRPRLVFRPRAAVGFLRFGLSTSGTQILYYLYNRADTFIVGRLFGAAALGLYRAASDIVFEPVRVVGAVFVEISYPTFARLRDQKDALATQLVNFIRQNLVAVLPFTLVIAVATEETLALTWGQAYTPAAGTARVLCAVAVLRVLGTVLPPLIDGLGRPGATLRATALAATLLAGISILFGWLLGPRLGATAMAWAWLASYPLALAVLAFIGLRLGEVSARVVARGVAGVLACAAVALVAAAGAHALAAPLPGPARLAVVAAVTVLALGGLLAGFLGITPRSLMSGLRGGGGAPATQRRSR